VHVEAGRQGRRLAAHPGQAVSSHALRKTANLL
jgi:hypothetical protein